MSRHTALNYRTPTGNNSVLDLRGLLVWSSLKECRQYVRLTPHLPTIIGKRLFEQLTPIATSLPQVLSTPSTTPTLLVFIPKRFWGAWSQYTEVHYLQCPGCRRGRTSSPLLGGEGQPRPPATPSLLGLPGRPGRARQALRRPPAALQCSESAAASGRDESPGHLQTSTRPPPGSGVTETTPGPLPTPRLGQVPGLLADTHPQPLLPVRRCRRLALTPVASSRGGSGPGAASPPDPPWVRAERGPSPMRAAAAPFPPSSFSASLPPRPASYFLDPVSARAWQANLQLQGSRWAPSLARHKDGAAGDGRWRSREASYTHTGGRGPMGKAVNEDSLNWLQRLPQIGNPQHQTKVTAPARGTTRTHAHNNSWTSTRFSVFYLFPPEARGRDGGGGVT